MEIKIVLLTAVEFINDAGKSLLLAEKRSIFWHINGHVAFKF